MARILILGPSQWLGGKHASTPLEDRRRIASALQEQGHDADLVEVNSGPKEEHPFARFRRLLLNADAVLIYWPLRGRLHGLNMELGHPLAEIQDHRLDPDHTYLVTQRRFRPDPNTGYAAYNEPGNRTRYYIDLIATGCRIRTRRSFVASFARSPPRSDPNPHSTKMTGFHAGARLPVMPMRFITPTLIRPTVHRTANVHNTARTLKYGEPWTGV